MHSIGIILVTSVICMKIYNISRVGLKLWVIYPAKKKLRTSLALLLSFSF